MEKTVNTRQHGQDQTEYINETARLYYDDIYRFLCFQTANADLASDLTQETFLRFIRYVHHEREKNLKGYLLTIAMNVCRDCWKKENPRRQEQPLDDLELADTDHRAEPESRMALQEALLRLPEFQREAIVLHYYYDYKYREISKMTGAQVSTVKSRIRQGCEKLKALLKEEDFSM